MSDFSFSNRTNWSAQNNPLSVAVEALQSQGQEILDLTESNPTRCGFNYPLDLLNLLSDRSNLTYAPIAKGTLEARQAIVDYYAQRKLSISAEDLVLTSSTSEGYSFLLKLLTNAGDHVLIPQPCYPLFQFLLELHDVEFDYYPLVYQGQWRIDQEAFKALITPRTRCVILVNPNNPTGSFLAQQDRDFLNQICQKNNLSIISDEVFLDYSLEPAAVSSSLINNHEAPSFVLSGVSKILGLPQMKLSWIAVRGPESFTQAALEKLEIIADTYLSVNTPVQNALACWLAQSQDIQDQIIGRVRENLKILTQQQLDTFSVEGGWYAIIKLPAGRSEEDTVLELLKQERLLVHPGYFFDFPDEGYLVVSLLPQSNLFQKGINKLLKVIV